MKKYVNKKLKMVNIIGINLIDLNKILKKKKYKNKIFITNHNNEYNFSVGGPINEIKSFLREKKISKNCNVVYLNVETAWHSKYLKPSSKLFYEYLKKFVFRRKCKYSLIENVKGIDLKELFRVQLICKTYLPSSKIVKLLRILKEKVTTLHNLSDFSNLTL